MLKNLFNKLFPIKYRIIFQPTGMTLIRWRNSPANAEMAAELFSHQTFQDIYSLMVTHRPAGFPTRGDKAVCPTRAAIELGRTLGYDDALRLLVSLAIQPPLPPEQIESTYGRDIDEDSND